MPGLFQRLRARLRNRGFDDDLREELRLHEEMKREELEAGGATPADARAEEDPGVTEFNRMAVPVLALGVCIVGRIVACRFQLRAAGQSLA